VDRAGLVEWKLNAVEASTFWPRALNNFARRPPPQRCRSKVSLIFAGLAPTFDKRTELNSTIRIGSGA